MFICCQHARLSGSCNMCHKPSPLLARERSTNRLYFHGAVRSTQKKERERKGGGEFVRYTFAVDNEVWSPPHMDDDLGKSPP